MINTLKTVFSFISEIVTTDKNNNRSFVNFTLVVVIGATIYIAIYSSVKLYKTTSRLIDLEDQMKVIIEENKDIYNSLDKCKVEKKYLTEEVRVYKGIIRENTELLKKIPTPPPVPQSENNTSPSSGSEQ